MPKKMYLVLCLLALACTGCIGRAYMVGSVVQDVVEASQRQTDLFVIRKGTPAYLMLMDGLIHSNPGNQRLLVAGAQAYFFYSLAVDDREEERKLLDRAKRYALRALELNKRYASCKDLPLSEYAQCVNSAFSKKDVPALYWAANCWGSWIGVHLDSVKALAQLPRAELLMKRVLELDETYQYGGAHLFLGVYESSRPGGDLVKARQHFEKALQVAQGKVLMNYVYYAKYYAIKAGDRQAFRRALQTVLRADPDRVPELTLQNTIARRKAQEMLEKEKDYFLD